MTNVRLLWQHYRYFPYERDFARREVEHLLHATPVDCDDGLSIPLNGHDHEIFQRLTYFREVVFTSGQKVVPQQAAIESSWWSDHSEASQQTGLGGMPRRQYTRYSAHGIHEYRGKFNPQIVRAIGNMLRLPAGAWVLDPFCGSGTALLECAHVGWNAAGIDLNPFGVLISRAKLSAIHADPDDLLRSVTRLHNSLEEWTTVLSFDRNLSSQEMAQLAGDQWENRLPNFDYLTRWFPLPVLAQFAAILCAIDKVVPEQLADVFKVILSDLTRNASFQDPGDLRVRRRKQEHVNYPVIPEFVKTADIRISSIVRARRIVDPRRYRQDAFLSDSRECLSWLTSRLIDHGFQGFDAVICSPPYATALPYIDTQRLSLCLLGLVSSRAISKLDRALVGSREIEDGNRKALEKQIIADCDAELPVSVANLCKRMILLGSHPDNGFRRRNMGALIYRYFRDMAKVFQAVRDVIQLDGKFALVVGQNKTILGGEQILIDTPRLLMDVALKNGWCVQDVIPMDTYNRYDVHQKNSIKSEELVVLERG